MSPEVFESRVAFLARHYTPVNLDQVFAAAAGAPLPQRAVLVTFDDAYASIARSAASILARHGMPAVFFVNSAFLDGATIGLDNLLCFAMNTVGLDALDRAAESIVPGLSQFRDLAHVIQGFTSQLRPGDIDRFRTAILEQLDQDPVERARMTGLYLTAEELCSLGESGIEVGNHTRTHAWCRNLDESGCDIELLGGRIELERMTGRPVRAFSVPYGVSSDLTSDVRAYLLRNGHRALFLVEGLPNGARPALDSLNRVSLKGTTDHETFTELEMLPRLRRIRNFLRGRGR